MSPRTQYATNEILDERRAERNNYDYDNRLKSEYKEHHDHRIKSDYEEQHQPSSQPRRMAVHHNVERVKIKIIIIINFDLKFSNINYIKMNQMEFFYIVGRFKPSTWMGKTF